MNNDKISDLKLFNEKAAFLQNSSFADSMLRNQSGVLFSWKAGEKYESVIVGAEGESVDAMLLTLRMFLQNNDRISIGNIAKIYSQEQDLAAYRSKFDSIRHRINVFLDVSNSISFFGKNYTNRETIDLCLYGSKGHSNREKEAELHSLMEAPIVWQVFLNQFNNAVAVLIKGIMAVAEINKDALIEIEADAIKRK